MLCPAWVRTGIADSSAHRPERLQNPDEPEPDPSSEAQMEGIRELVATGLPPERVAEAVLEAVRDERLYVLTHPELKPAIEARMRNILEERNP